MYPWYECFVFHFALSPLYIHGNRCPKGSATSKMNNVKYVYYDLWKVQTSTSVLLFSKRRVRIHLWWKSLLICSDDPPMRQSHLNSFVLVMALLDSWMCMCIPFYVLFMTVCSLLSLCSSKNILILHSFESIMEKWTFLCWQCNGCFLFL